MAEIKSSNGHRADIWTRVIGGVAGALILGLQGVNISETSGQTSYIQRIDTALEQQLSLTKEVNQEGQRIDQALQNQEKMIESMDTLLHNQNTALELLTKKSPTTNP